MKKQPNILFILADDLGWCDLGADGSTFHESPNLDRLAAAGMRFSQAYAACQVCSPSRASILTGKYPPRHGVTDWIGAKSGTEWRKAGRHSPLLPPEYAHCLSKDETTLAQAFLNAGYRTFFAGKWHCGEQDGEYPDSFGFETNKGGWSAGGPRSYFSPYANPKLEDGEPGESLPLRLARETTAFISEHQDEPFFAYLSFYSVHGPIQTSRDRWAKFREKALARGAPESRFIFDKRLPVRQVQDCPIYGGMIEAMDDAIGLVLGKLDELGLSKDTIVVFTSDNGGVSSGDCYSSSMLPLRGGKGRQWEGGIRVPLYARVPGVTAAGSRCDVPVSGIDIYPTLVELAGLPMPKNQSVDGLALVPLLRGEPDARITERDLFWHYPHYANQGGDPSSSIRRGDWKLIHYHEDGHDELYDLAMDIGEQHDVSSGHAEIARQLRERLDQWLDDIGAVMPAPDPAYDPGKERAYLDTKRHDLMPRLEAEHADYLDPTWQPNPDWWGSWVIRD